MPQDNFPLPHRRGCRLRPASPRAQFARPTALTALLTLAWPLMAAAQANPGADALRSLERQNTIIERQQQERLRDDQQRALPQPGAPGGADLNNLQPQVKVPDLGTCRDVKEVRIEGAVHLPADVRGEIERGNAGRCLAAKDLEAILANITRSYIERGFVTTRAYLPAQDLTSGVLKVAVVEGTIERIELQNTGRPGAKVNLAGAFPAAAGDLLNLRDLEQGVDQINSLLSNSATLDLQPGTQPGQSVVLVNNQASFPLHLYLNWDNLGTPSTGRYGLSATLSADGLLGLNENIAFTRRQSFPYDSEHHSELSALHVAVPFGYSTFSYDISESTYTNALYLPSGTRLDSEGRTLSQSLGLDRVVFRDQASRISLGARLSNQDSRSFLGGEFLGVASRKLSALDLGATAFTQMGGGILNGRLAYVQGLTAFGALNDPNYLPEDYPHAQGRKWVTDLGYSRRFEAGPVPLMWTSQFSGQYSDDVLYGLQQILVGGPSSVRGSLVNALSGDRGYYLRNDLSLPWQRALGNQAFSGRFYVGYDFGAVRNNAPGVPSGSMSGITLGAALQWRTASAEVFASRALHLPGFFTPEGTLWGVRLSFAL
ncbi:ShlB/FhaC/HecB family hemolysin secretion/activation protein [Variovorax dokdonensis]|uniref:ShlB/FhaC/HecB family hemolysin secretion/activation protein n=1 Tax=Variovorax dokdonensis TaxID=344883 RepID=A0ABT7N718_9BURK|nr:ShlB/FhaC/HecB family hemolysin secretion/activation protein [Variovorax dokdonensis]MDM0043741.1 ShlB/FhaC/HecB family hemolysin secretion/activation protein [Variovorax dokdonensis]